MTRKTVSEMTYNVSSGTLNSTIPYLYHTVSNKTKLSLLLLLSPVETAGEVLFLVHGVFLFVSWPGYEKIAAMVVKLSK